MTALPERDFVPGDVVSVNGAKGTVRFYGTTEFAPGKWVGIELPMPTGKNDGSVKDKRYFVCEPNHGSFVRPPQVTLITPADGDSGSNTPPVKVASPAPAQVEQQQQQAPSPVPTPTPTPTLPLAVERTATPPVVAPVAAVFAAVVPEEPPKTPAKQEQQGDLSFSQSPQQQVVPLKQFEELKAKFRILENKRLEDREKLKELEHLRSEIQTINVGKQKQDETIKDLQKQLKDVKRDFAEYREEKENEGSVAELMDNIELLTVDKEVAEEKVDALQQEVDSLKERIDELQLELEIKKEETSSGTGGGSGSGSVSSAELEQLEKQNEKLKEALVKLRDVTTAEKNELTKKVKELEKVANEVPSLAEKLAKLKKENQDLLEHVDDLKEQVEAASGAEAMIEELGNQKLTMEDRIANLLTSVEDLETLRQLNEELEENHIETEKQLQSEIEFKDSVLARQQASLDAASESAADYEQTIFKFRELVQQLQGDIESLKAKESGEEAAALSSQSQTMQTLKLELQSTATKAQAKAVALDLRRLDAEQANDHIGYLLAFLPQLYFDGEQESINIMLSIKRILFKTDLVVKYLEQTYRIDQGRKHNTAVSDSEMAHICIIRAKLVSIVGNVRRLYLYAQTCSLQEYATIAAWKNDLTNVERRVDVFVELVRKEDFNDKISIQDLQRALGQVENLTSAITVASAAFGHTGTPQLLLYGELLECGADSIFIELRNLFGRLQRGTSAEDQQLLVQPLAELQKVNKSIQVLAKKLHKRLEEIGVHPLLNAHSVPANSTYKRIKSGSIATTLQEHQNKLELLQKLLSNVGLSVPSNAADEDPMQVDVPKVTEAIAANASSILQVKRGSAGPETVWNGVLEWARAEAQILQSLLEETMDEQNVESIAISPTPWQLKAESLRTLLAVNPALQKKIESLQSELVLRVTEVKSLHQRLDEKQTRIEMLESRVETSATKSTQSEAENSKLHSQVKMYADATKSLQRDLEQLERENEQLKKASKTRPSKTVSGSSSSSAPSSLLTAVLTQNLESSPQSISYD